MVRRISTIPAQKDSDITKKKLTPELSEKLIEFQLKEITLKEKEIELKKKETDNNYHFAKESLKFQSEDYRDLRKRESAKEKIKMIMICVTAFMFFSFLMGAMLLNKDEVLSDIIKVAGYVFGGGITGYGLGVHKGKEKGKLDSIGN